MSDRLVGNQIPNIPTEEEIEGLLSRFKPMPTARFHDIVQEAPWFKSTSARKKGLLASAFRTRWLAGAVALLTILLTLSGILFIPTVRGIARQIIFTFLPAPTNQIEVQITVTSPGDLFQSTNPLNYPLSVDEVQSQASFPVKQISVLPKDLLLVGARFDSGYKAVILLYHSDGYDLFLTQRPLGNGQDVFSIGPAAEVIHVKVGDIPAEFVRGGWKAVSTQVPPERTTTVQPISITAEWDNELPQYTLRWQAGDYSYELRSVGIKSPSQSVLLKLANELK